MALPDISIHISANAVAWYAAIVSTIGLLISLYTVWKDRPHIRISITPDMRVINVPPYNPNKYYIDVTIRNRGRRPTKISTVFLKLYRTKGYILLSDSLYGHVNRVLTEENPRANFFVEQNLIDPKRIEYVLVCDDAGHVHIKYYRWLAFVRRFVSKWLYELDCLEPPDPRQVMH
jgi:hypothetical protein